MSKGFSAQHSVTLEEIARLERERDEINRKIAALRSTLPKQEVAVKVRQEHGQTRTMMVPSEQAPVKAMVAAPLPKAQPRMSDHAVIRVLERRYGFDFEKFRDQLLTPTVRLGIELGARAVKAPDGGKFTIRENCVTSYVPANDVRSKKKKKRAQREREL